MWAFLILLEYASDLNRGADWLVLYRVNDAFL
jgi:hypothetical protein